MDIQITTKKSQGVERLLEVSIPLATVNAEEEKQARRYATSVRLPGFRPGKAPRAMIVKKYETEIKDEAKRKLIGEGYRNAIAEKKISVVGQPDIEEIQFGRGQALQFAATVETAPEFQLPEYKGLPAHIESKAVTEADVTRALDLLRGQHAKFETVARPLTNGDVAVVNYSGTCDGKAITEIAPTAKGLTEQKNFWIETADSEFIPGFAAQLVGAQAGEKRTVNVDFPADFVTRELSGKKGVYQVELVEVKEKVLPALNEEFAKKFGAENLEKLTSGVRTDLENELKYSRTKAIRNQIVTALMGKVNFDLPETAVANETRNVVYDLVRQNTQRGVARELIETQKDEIYTAAAASAKDRVKLAFIVGKIAGQEKIEVTQDDAVRRAQQLAMMYQMPLDQFLKDLQKRNGVNELYEQVQHEKVLELLEKNAALTETPAK